MRKQLQDSDKDNLPDRDESIHGLSRWQADADGDGLLDGDELLFNHDPHAPDSADILDINGDGLVDALERTVDPTVDHVSLVVYETGTIKRCDTGIEYPVAFLHQGSSVDFNQRRVHTNLPENPTTSLTAWFEATTVCKWRVFFPPNGAQSAQVEIEFQKRASCSEASSLSEIENPVEIYVLPRPDGIAPQSSYLPWTGEGYGDGPGLFVATVTPTDIIPGSGMIGVVGDIIPSAKPNSKVKHFVTPKEAAEIPQDLLLEAQGRKASDFAENAKQRYEWRITPATAGTPKMGNDAHQVTLNRDTAEKVLVELLKMPRTSGDQPQVAAKMFVWVVWAECDPLPAAALFPPPGPTQSIFTLEEGALGGHKFAYIISPAELFTGYNAQGEVPDLSGPPTTLPPGNPVKHVLHSNFVSDFAQLKWDTSRQMKLKMRNPSNLKDTSGDFWFKLYTAINPAQNSSAWQTILDYPNNAAQGNDDINDQTSRTNPYIQDMTPGLEKGISEIVCWDQPRFEMYSNWGKAHNDELGFSATLRDFARLEILGPSRQQIAPWYRISDYTYFHHTMKAKFFSPINSPTQEWRNAESSAGLGQGP